MTMPALIESRDAPDPMATVRAWKRMVAAGFTLSVRDDRLIVAPADRLTDSQRTWLKSHKITLIELLHDAETLYNGLIDAGPTGLDWREGTPPDWSDDRLLAAGEVLYGDGRMVNRNERRYAGPGALRTEPDGVVSPSVPTARLIPAVADAPGPDTDPFAVRASERMAEGRARWNAAARTEVQP